MAHVEENSGKKSSVVELNLVPFIDLMSVCIIFLLITAVWIQISMIQLGTSVYSKKQDDPPIPPSLTPHQEVPFRVDVLSEGYKVVLGSEAVMIPLVRKGTYNHKALTRQIEAVKKIYPEKIDVVVTSRDNLMYKHLIMAMDLLLNAGFSGISIATGEVI